MVNRNHFIHSVLLVGVLLFAAFMHLYLLNSYPPGLDPDAGQDGMDTLKPLRYNIWPFYLIINANADPMFVYTAAATTGLFGARVLALRFASAAYGLLGIAATYLCLLELGRNSLDPPTRKVTALLAIAALASSQVIALIDRMGLRFITTFPVQMLSIWALARAGRTGRPVHWAVAGLLAGLTQYTYPSARVLPLLWLFVIGLKFWQEREHRRSFVVGLPVFALAALVALLPQGIWYAQHPNTFLARAGQTSFTQNPVYAEGGLPAVLNVKFAHYWTALTDTWNGQYDQIKEPLFPMLFVAGAGLGLIAAPFRRNRWFVAYVLCGLGVMLLPDLISGDRDWPHELRLIGAYPFLAGLAGLGLASVVAAVRHWPSIHRLASPVLVGVVGLTMLWQANEFFNPDLNYGKLYYSGNIWLRRIDYGVANHITSSNEPFLIPLSNYSDTVVKYLTSNRALHIRSALDASGHWLPHLNQPVTLLLPNEDDNALWQGDPQAQWALFEGDTVYILPPLAEINSLLPALDDSTLMYDLGQFDFVQVGHARQIAATDLPVESLTPDYPLDTCFEPGMCLIGASYNDPHLQAGNSLRVNLFWQTRKPVGDDYVMFVHLLDKDGNAIAGKDEYPLSHGYRTYEWGTDETILTQTVIQLPADLPPGPYALEAGFYLPYEAKRVAAFDGAGNPIGDRAYFQNLKVARPVIQLPADASSTQITFSDELSLIGYRIDSLPAEGQPLRLTLWWQGLKPASQNWTEFLHLTPAEDSQTLLGQTDRGITGGLYPPTIWDEAELVEEQVEINATELSAGRYEVWLGLYSPVTFERVAVTVSPTPAQENRVLLLEFELK